MINIDPDDDDDERVGLYENGHWVWDDNYGSLVFISDLPDEPEAPITTAIVSCVEFIEDVDLNEQQRFRKRIQRKPLPGEADVVTLQDVKDVVLFTAPSRIVTPMLISLLHQPATERLLRGLIALCQYYLQIADIMSQRKKETETKVHTPESDRIEAQYQEDLEDLRLLVAKEYANFLLGSGELAKFHHMGASKTLRSLSKRDSLFFETFIRFIVQIVWVALGRKSYAQIELEINRLFKSQIFNSAQHKLNNEAMNKLQEQLSPFDNLKVMRGQCVQKQYKINMVSPLISEIRCHRPIDHHMYGLGCIKYPWLNQRLAYMECILALPEFLFEDKHVSVGILGLSRSRFDILLKEITITSQCSASNINISKQAICRSSSSRSSRRKSTVSGPLYMDIKLPTPTAEDINYEFPTESLPRRRCNENQRQKWMDRYLRIQARSIRKSTFCSD